MSTTTKKPQNKNKILRIMKIPFRALGKIRTFYVRSMMSYAGKMNYGNRPAQYPGLPKSYSANAAAGRSTSYRDNNEDFRELVRAASARTIGTRFDFDSPEVKPKAAERVVSGGGAEAAAMRSKSVVMGRIDEDSPCNYFGGENGNINNIVSGGVNMMNVQSNKVNKYPRSRSQAATRRTVF